jgi:hypothetical protein
MKIGKKKQCEESFRKGGVEAVIPLAISLMIKESRLRRWIKKWSNGAVVLPPIAHGTTSTTYKRVLLYPRDKSKAEQWFGLLIEKGEGLCVVKITEAPIPELIGQTRYMQHEDVQLVK